MSHILPTISLVNGIPTVSSLEIAEKFGKTHKAVLRAIQNLMVDLDDEFRKRNFALTSRTVPGPNNSQREEPYFNLTRLDWLRNVAAQPSPILNSREPVSRAIDYSPLHLIRHLEKAHIG